MTRYRKTILASALVAASLTASTPAHAYSFGGMFGFVSGWWLGEASSSSGGTGLLFTPLSRPVR